MPLLGVLAVFVLLLAVQGWAYRRFWNRGLEVDLRFSEKTGVEGGTLSLVETVSSRKLLPLPWLTVKFHVSRNLGFEDSPHAVVTDDYYRQDLFSLGMYQRVTRTLRIDLKKRGYYTIRSLDLLSSDLLLAQNLVSRASSDSTLTVVPRPIPREAFGIRFDRLVGSLIVRSAPLPDPFEFRTIREYQTFDTLKSVNWLATARTGDLKVNVHECTASREVLVLLNVRGDREHDDDRPVEDCLRIASTLCEGLVEEGISVGLVSNGCDVVTGQPVSFEPGQTLSHVRAIQEQLGRLDLSRRVGDFAEVLETRDLDLERGPMLLLVSYSCTRRLSDAWTDALARGHQGLWILPRYPWRPDDRTPAIPDAFLPWEVTL